MGDGRTGSKGFSLESAPSPRLAEMSERELIPRLLCWGLFGVSLLLLLVEIWNYIG